jgi:hypothetical protein
VTQPDLDKVTRLTVVDDTGRAYEKFGVALRFAVQDDGKTLKVFATERSPEEQAQTKAEVHAGWVEFFTNMGVPPCTCPQHQAADEMARLTNDMGLYGPDQEASA